MPTAREVAAELRRIADALDKEPDTKVQQVWLTFYCKERDVFLNTANLLPRPLTKRYESDDARYGRLHLEHKHEAVDLDCSIERVKICRIVRPAQPAEFECEPLL